MVSAGGQRIPRPQPPYQQAAIGAPPWAGDQGGLLPPHGGLGPGPTHTSLCHSSPRLPYHEAAIKAHASPPHHQLTAHPGSTRARPHTAMGVWTPPTLPRLSRTSCPAGHKGRWARIAFGRGSTPLRMHRLGTGAALHSDPGSTARGLQQHYLEHGPALPSELGNTATLSLDSNMPSK